MNKYKTHYKPNSCGSTGFQSNYTTNLNDVTCIPCLVKNHRMKEFVVGPGEKIIEECNFKREIKKDIHYPPKMIMNKGVYCRLTGANQAECNGEENCILFQLYKTKQVKK